MQGRGRKPLYHAVSYDHLPIVRLFIPQPDIKLDIKNPIGLSLLFTALDHPNIYFNLNTVHSAKRLCYKTSFPRNDNSMLLCGLLNVLFALIAHL